MLKSSQTKLWNYPINGSQIFFIAFLIYFLPIFLSETTFEGLLSDHILRIISYVALLLILFKIFVLDRWIKKQQLLICGILLIYFIVWRRTMDIQLISVVPFILGAKDVKFKDIIRWYIYIWLALIMAVMVFALLGIIPNLIYHSPDRPTRYSLGMNYPSHIAAHYMYLVLAYCYLRFNKLNFLDYIFIIIGDFICLLLTNTRLDFIAVIILIPVMIIAQRAYRGYKWSQCFASFWWMAIPISATVTIICSYFYNSNNKIMRKINSLSSGRLFLGNEAFEKYNVNLFGRRVVEHSFSGIKGMKFVHDNSHYFYIDSAYVRMLLLWGLLVFLMISVCLTFIALRSTVHKTFILSAIILVASLNFMFEPNIINLIYNPFILALFAKPYYLHIKEKLNDE